MIVAIIHVNCYLYLLQCSFINGSPQNTNVPGVIDLAGKHKVFIGGDDFKSGQTKMKSVLVDFLVSSGLKVLCTTVVPVETFHFHTSSQYVLYRL